MRALSGTLQTGVGESLFQNVELGLVEAGWTCLLGPSGVGKTTILRLLAGLDVHGEFVGDLADLDVAYMAQQDLLMPWLDVTGNVTFGYQLRGQTPDKEFVESLIERVGLAPHSKKFPRQLSGGMRQRAALARTLTENRNIVLLDEPFSALDAKTRAEMQELAHDLLGGKTVMLVTHDPLEAARLGDQILVMDRVGVHQARSKSVTEILDVHAAETLKLQSELLLTLRARVK